MPDDQDRRDADDSPPGPRPEVWWVYVLRRGDGALYTGIATDVERRVAEHEAGEGRGAKALRGRGPLVLELSHAAGPRGRALKLEAAIKRLSKARKERLLGDAALLAGLLERIDRPPPRPAPAVSPRPAR